jgi:GTPase SAR1 family protein
VREIARDDYEPSITDILNARARTTGIVESHYIIKGVEFVIVDVGGQRNERKKWMHCFEDMNATIFVAALSEYDQTLFEDETQNRMVEALEMFNQAINSSWLAEVDVILFLNKMDLFAEKIEHSNIADVPAFSDYNGGENNFDAGVEYFRQKFLSENQVPNKEIITHVTCATDTKNVSHVFNSCRKIILQKNLQESGMLG